MSDSLKQQKRKKEIKECALKLRELSRMDGNKFCADCGQRNPKWVSVNIGVWICMRCSGSHRNLGVHHSFVKSTTLDDWNYELLKQFKSFGGNSSINTFYEAKLIKKNKINHETNEYKVMDFIRNKYVDKMWYQHKKNKKIKNIKKKKANKQHHEPRQQKLEKIKIKMDINPKPKHEGYSIDSNPENWITFNNDEKSQHFQHSQQDEPKKDMIPDLLSFDNLYRFQFSDLATFEANNGKNNNTMDSFDPLNKSTMIYNVKENDNKLNSHKLDKSAILSKYNDNPSTWKQFTSSSPKSIATYNQFNFVQYHPYHSYNEYNQYNQCNQYNQYTQYNQYNQYNISSSSPPPVIRVKSNYDSNVNSIKQNPKQVILSNYAQQQPNINECDDNPFRDNNNMNMNMNMNDEREKEKESFINPFNHINNLCKNNNCYVFNGNVSC